MSARWTNWARTERSSPALTVAPRTQEQVVRAVQRALETGHTVKPIGASHSFTGIGATDGIRLDMSRLRGLVDVDLERDRVTLWAGTHLWELPAILGPLGLDLENLGDIDRQTISGATSTGTHGTGLRFGGLATRITAVTLVTGTGEVLTIDETQHAELLPAVAVGLGALGVLVTLTIQCVPRFLVHAVEAPRGFDAAVEEFEARSRAADHFEFFWFPHTQVARTKTNTRLPGDAGARARTPLARFVEEEFANNLAFGALAAFGRWVPGVTPRVNRLIAAGSSRRDYIEESHRAFVTPRRVRFRETEYAIPLDAVPTAMRDLRAMIERRGFNVSFPIEVRSSAATALWLSPSYGRETGHIAVHRYIGDPDREYLRAAEEILAAHDGRPHWGKLHSLGAEELRGRYPAFDDFLAVRDRLDPHRVFQNPYLQRVLGR